LRQKGFHAAFSKRARTFEFSTPESLLDNRFRQGRYSFWWIALGARSRISGSGLSTTVEICYRESGEVIFQSAAGPETCALQRKVFLQDLRTRFRRTGAAAVSASTARFGRVSALPGILATRSTMISISWSPDKYRTIDEGAIKTVAQR